MLRGEKILWCLQVTFQSLKLFREKTVCVLGGGRGWRKKWAKCLQLVRLSEIFIILFFLFFSVGLKFFQIKTWQRKNLLILYNPTGTFEKVYPNKRIKVVHKDAWKKYTQRYKVHKAKNENVWDVQQHMAPDTKWHSIPFHWKKWDCIKK